MFSLISILFVFIYTSPGLTKDSNPQPLRLESDPLTTVSFASYIYRYNYSSFKSISQPNKNIAFLDCMFLSYHLPYLLEWAPGAFI